MNSKLLEEAIEMTPSERVTLAEILLESIDVENKEISKKWLLEAETRMASISSGDSSLLNFDQLYAQD